MLNPKHLRSAAWLAPLLIVGPLLGGCGADAATGERLAKVEALLEDTRNEVREIRDELDAEKEAALAREQEREAEREARRARLDERRAMRGDLKDPFGAGGSDSAEGEKLVAELVETIKCENDKCTVSAKAFEAVLAEPASMMRQARVVPAVRDGETQGFKFYGIRPGSVLKALGVKNGDMLIAVNGESMNSMDQAMAAYGKVKDAKELKLDMQRKGQPMTLVVVLE